MGICSELDENQQYKEFYDLSSLVTTLEVAKIRNIKKGNNLIQEMAKILQDLSIVENSNFYDKNDVNSFYNMLLEAKKID